MATFLSYNRIKELITARSRHGFKTVFVPAEVSGHDLPQLLSEFDGRITKSGNELTVWPDETHTSQN